MITSRFAQLLAIITVLAPLSATRAEAIVDGGPAPTLAPLEALALPGYLDTGIDPETGLATTRITRPGDLGAGVVCSEAYCSHRYSSAQAWNADQSMLALMNGCGGICFLDGKTFRPLFQRPRGIQCEWHPKEPEVMICVADRAVTLWEPRTNTERLVFSSDAYSELGFGPGKGNPSFDGKRIVVRAERSDGPVAFALDLETGSKFPDIDLSALPGSNGYCTISPLGEHIFCSQTTEDEIEQAYVFSVDGDLQQSWLEHHRPGHGDLTVDADGSEIYVGVSKAEPDEYHVIKRRLSDGQVTPLIGYGEAQHVSTRSVDLPGWAFVSFGGDPAEVASHPDWAQYAREVVAVRIDGSGEIRRIARTRNVPGDYWSETHASPSPDGTQVVWSSNWGVPAGPVHDFVTRVDWQANADLDEPPAATAAEAPAFTSPVLPPPPHEMPVVPAATQAASAQAQYEISPGDAIDLGISSLPEKTQRLVVQLDGTVVIPDAGAVEVAGLTLQQMQSRFEMVLPPKIFYVPGSDGSRQIVMIKPSDITTSIAEYRPVYVTGDVLTPGQQVYRPLMTVRQAIAVAGGVSLLRSRVTDTGGDMVELTAGYEGLWMDYVRDYFRNLRLRAELGGSDSFDKSGVAGSPVQPAIMARFAENEENALKLALEDAAKERDFLEKAITDAEAQIEILTEQSATETAALEADEDELGKLKKLIDAGNTTNTRYSEVRRAVLMSSSRLLDTKRELMRLHRVKEETARQIARNAATRRTALLADIAETYGRMTGASRRLLAISQKLRSGGSGSSALASDVEMMSSIAITRRNGDRWDRIVADPDVEIWPGDVIDVTFQPVATQSGPTN